MKHLNSKSSYLGRYDFWRLFIIGILVYIIIQIVYFSAWQTWFADKITLSTVIFIIINILYFVYDYIIGLKRFHDANHSTIFFRTMFHFKLCRYWLHYKDGYILSTEYTHNLKK